MKVFNINWMGWEGHNSHNFIHENKTAEEFIQDCKRAVQAHIDSLLVAEKYKISVEDIFSLLMTVLPKEYGYENETKEIEASFYVPGDECSYALGDTPDDGDIDFIANFGEETWTKVFEHNKSFDVPEKEETQDETT